MKPETASERGAAVAVGTAVGSEGPDASQGAPGRLILWWRRAGDSGRAWEPRALLVEDLEVLASFGQIGDGVAAVYEAAPGGAGRNLERGEVEGAVVAACQAVRAVAGFLEGLESEATAERELLALVREEVSKLRTRVQDLENSVFLRHRRRTGNRQAVSGGHDESRVPGSEQ